MEGLDVYSFISCNIIIILEGTTAYLSRVIGLWELWSKFLFRISFKISPLWSILFFYAYSFIIILHLTIVLNTFGYKFYIFKLQHTKAFLTLHNIAIDCHISALAIYSFHIANFHCKEKSNRGLATILTYYSFGQFFLI